MSLLSPDVVTLFISPTQVKGARSSGKGGRVKFALKTDAVVHANDAWRGLTIACEALCKELKPQLLHIVLSDSLVRYAAFPWREELRNVEEDLAFARLSFDEVYGVNASNEWHLSFSQVRPGESRLMVAVSKSLYNLLVTNFGGSLPPVKSIQTSFTRALSLSRSGLPASGWLVNREDDSVSFGSWNTQGWTWINTIRHACDSSEELATLLNQELSISGVNLDDKQPVTVVLNASGLNLAELPQLTGVRFKPLAIIAPAYAQLEEQS